MWLNTFLDELKTSLDNDVPSIFFDKYVIYSNQILAYYML